MSMCRRCFEISMPPPLLFAVFPLIVLFSIVRSPAPELQMAPPSVFA